MRETNVDRGVFESWLKAWMERDPQEAAALYADDATYQVTPFSEPLRGRPAILEYWTGVAKTEEKIQFGYEVLAMTSSLGIARWWASFVIVPPGLDTKLNGIFVITLDPEGRCKSLCEWWQKQQ